MRIILSPAKTMRREEELLPWSQPVFLDEAKKIIASLKNLTPAQRKKLWNCSDALAKENEQRLETMDLDRAVSPSVFSYSGLAYTHMAAEAMSDDDLAYLQEHLRILSAVYGVLKPMDAIVSYRLEMGALLSVSGCNNLYQFWGERLYNEVIKDDELIINLASKEYSDAVIPYASKNQIIQIDFVSNVKGKLVTKATLAKIARGSMVRWMAQHNVQSPEQLSYFDEGFTYQADRSDNSRYVFVQK